MTTFNLRSIFLCYALAFGSLLGFPVVVHAETPVVHIFLMQNSGWMQPFYSDPNSKFKPLVSEIIKRVRREKDEIVIASFNQSDGSNKSPLMLYRGGNDADIQRAVNRVELARRPGGAYADTDFKEALIGSIQEFSPGKPAILWIFTNNKNSPKNSPQTALKNKEFYTWLQNEPNIARIAAYPYKLAVQGNNYRANGVMIYAMAYGRPADALLYDMLKANRPFGGQSARLKPLNAEALTFIPKGTRNSSGVGASLGRDGKSLILEFSGGSNVQTAELVGGFRNDFYPYDIQSGNVGLGVQFRGESRGIKADVAPSSVKGIAAGGVSEDVRIRIAIPPLPSVWRPDILFGTGHKISGEMLFQLDNQLLVISPAFLAKMNDLFPGDPLPDLFLPGDSAKKSTTSRPILISVSYPLWPLLLVVLVGVIILGFALYLLSAVLRPKKFNVSVDGVQKTYMIKAFSTVSVQDAHGDTVGKLKRILGKPMAICEPNVTLTIKVI